MSLASIAVRLLPKAVPMLVRHEISGVREPFSAAIDVTSACNLRCTHCYLYRDEQTPYAMNKLAQLSNAEWLERLLRLKREHPRIAHVTWVGGEPLLRRDLLRLGTRLFPLNWVVTNGTVPIPSDLRRTAFVVSLDGPEEHHDELRGAGSYRRLRKNVAGTRAPVHAHSVITRRNRGAVGRLVEEWRDSPLMGIRFSFYTPEVGEGNELWLTLQERDDAIDELAELKARHPDFIWMTAAELDAFRSDCQARTFGDGCMLKRGWDVSLDHRGERKHPCVMGAKADCDRCGCTVPPMLHAIARTGDTGTLLGLLRTFTREAPRPRR